MPKKMCLLFLAGLGLVQTGARARAGERLAKVVEWKEALGQPVCGQRIEALLKAEGYRVVDSSYPREKLDLRVVTRSDCRLDENRFYVCRVDARVGGPSGEGFELWGQGDSLGTWSPALDEACRQLTERLAESLHGAGPGGVSTRPPACQPPS